MNKPSLALIGIASALFSACTDHITDPRSEPYAASTVWSTNGPGFATGYATAADPDGNVYITGEFKGVQSFGDITLTGGEGTSAFIAKYSPTGQVLWAQQVGPTDTSAGLGIAVDGRGNVYVTGALAQATQSSAAAAGEGSVIVAKYSTDGVLQWAQPTGKDVRIQGHDLAVDESGNVYITGLFEGTVVLGTTTLISRPAEVKIGGREDIFVAKLSTTGEYQWARQAGGGSLDGGFGIAVDKSGNVYTTGVFSNTADFGGTSLTTEGAEQNLFVAKYRGQSGEQMWVSKAGTGWGRGITLDAAANGNAYVIGDNSILKVSNENGTILWRQALSGSGTYNGFDIATDAQGDVFATGAFRNTLTIGKQTITAEGEQDLFLAKLNSSGSLLNLLRDGGAGDEVAYAIATAPAAIVYLTGYFHSPSRLAGKELTSSGGGLFLIQYKE